MFFFKVTLLFFITQLNALKLFRTKTINCLSDMKSLITLKAFTFLHQKQESDRALEISKIELLKEVDEYNSLSASDRANAYENHDRKMNKILQYLTNGALKLNLQQMHFFSKYDQKLQYISSKEDDTNVNDKIWKLALKAGEVTKTQDARIPTKFHITMKFTEFCILRYVYRVQTEYMKTGNDGFEGSDIPIKYLEFEWFVFGKRLYNRMIDRNEIWRILYEDPDITLLQIRNSDKEESIYNRKLMFR